MFFWESYKSACVISNIGNGKMKEVTFAIMERSAESGTKQDEKIHFAKRDVILKLAVGMLALLLIASLALVVFEHNQVLALQSEISQRDSVIQERDTLITQLDTAIHLAESRLNLKLPNGSRYLTTLPDQNNEENSTKIFLSSTAAGYHYLPAYPFTTPWFNGSDHYFSSRRAFELTENRSITLSFWGWTFDAGGLLAGMYEYQIGSYARNPVLIIAVTIRNDYTSTDLDAPIGNRTGSYVSSINLAVRLYSENGSIIEAPKAHTSASERMPIGERMAIGGAQFLLGANQTKKVIFYLSPSTSDIEAIDHYEIYVSSLSAY